MTSNPSPAAPAVASKTRPNPTDEWATNPYKPTDPRFIAFEEEMLKAQRDHLRSRFNHAARLRRADYLAGHLRADPLAVQMSARSASPQTAQTSQSAVSSDVAPKSAAAQPPAPRASVQFTTPLSVKATSVLTLSGGTVVWVGLEDGTIVEANGVTGQVLRAFDPTITVDGGVPFRRDVNREVKVSRDPPPAPAADDGKKKEEAASNTTEEKKTNEQAPVSEEKKSDAPAADAQQKPADETTKDKKDPPPSSISVTALLEVGKDTVAVGLADGRVRLVNTITLLAADGYFPDAKRSEGAATSVVALVSASSAVDHMFVISFESGGVVTKLRVGAAPSSPPSAKSSASPDDLPDEPVVSASLTLVCSRKLDTTIAGATSRASGDVFIVDQSGNVFHLDREDLGKRLVAKTEFQPPTPPPGDDGKEKPQPPKDFARIVVALPYGNAVAAVCQTVVIVLNASNGSTITTIQPFGPEAAISLASLDARANRLWLQDTKSATLSGIDLHPDAKYAVRGKSVVGEPNGALTQASFLYAHADAQRLWTLASNGINVAWLTEYGKAQCEATDAADIHRIAAEQQAKSLELIREGVTKYTKRVAHARASSAAALGTGEDKGLANQYLLLWLRFRVRRHYLRKRPAFAALLEAAADRRTAAPYFSRWLHLRNVRRFELQRKVAANFLEEESALVTRRRAFQLLALYLQERQAARRRLTIVQTLTRNVEASRLRRAYLRWQRLRARRTMARKRAELAITLRQRSDLSAATSVFLKWNRFAAEAARSRRIAHFMQALLNLRDTMRRRHAYAAFKGFLRRRKLQRLAATWAPSVSSRLDLTLLRRYFAALAAVRVIKQLSRVAATEAQKTEQVTVLRERLEEAKPRIARQEELTKLRERLAELQKRRDELKASVEANRETVVSLTSEQQVRRGLTAEAANFQKAAAWLLADCVSSTADKAILSQAATATPKAVNDALIALKDAFAASAPVDPKTEKSQPVAAASEPQTQAAPSASDNGQPADQPAAGSTPATEATEPKEAAPSAKKPLDRSSWSVPIASSDIEAFSQSIAIEQRQRIAVSAKLVACAGVSLTDDEIAASVPLASEAASNFLHLSALLRYWNAHPPPPVAPAKATSPKKDADSAPGTREASPASAAENAATPPKATPAEDKPASSPQQAPAKSAGAKRAASPPKAAPAKSAPPKRAASPPKAAPAKAAPAKSAPAKSAAASPKK